MGEIEKESKRDESGDTLKKIADFAKANLKRKNETFLLLFKEDSAIFKNFERKISQSLVIKFSLLFIGLCSIPAIIFVRTFEHLLWLVVGLIILLPISVYDAKRHVKELKLSELATRRWLNQSALIILFTYLLFSLLFFVGVILFIFLWGFAIIYTIFSWRVKKKSTIKGIKKGIDRYSLVSMIVEIGLAVPIIIFSIIKFPSFMIQEIGLVIGLNVAFLGYFCGQYLFYTRLKGAGLTYIFAISLVFDFLYNPHFNSQIAGDYRALVQNLDKWYAEEFNLRLMNMDEVIQAGYALIATNLSAFQNEFQKLLEENLTEWSERGIQKFMASENLSSIVKKLSTIVDVNIRFEKNSILSAISRNLGNIGTTTIVICTIISTVISILASLFL